jgi:hypothetical protein
MGCPHNGLVGAAPAHGCGAVSSTGNGKWAIAKTEQPLGETREAAGIKPAGCHCSCPNRPIDLSAEYLRNTRPGEPVLAKYKMDRMIGRARIAYVGHGD